MADHTYSPPPLRPDQGPLPLQYAQPDPRQPLLDVNHPGVRVVRRLVFSFGCFALAFGAVSAWAQVNRTDAPYWAGWGAGLIALTASGWRTRRAA